jgi:RNA polymerase sigma-70 factor (ECF subfamily)
MGLDESFETVMLRLRAGDDDAAAVVFRRFTHRLMALARTRLELLCGSRADIEDLIQSVYKSFFSRYAQGQFHVDDWSELWGLLTVITLRKCANRRTYLQARRRDVRRLLTRAPQGGAFGPVCELVDREPTPLEAAALADLVQELFRGLNPPDRQTVSMLLQGYTAQEIANVMTCSERTVRRVRSRLKVKLKHLYGEDDNINMI